MCLILSQDPPLYLNLVWPYGVILTKSLNISEHQASHLSNRG